MDDFEPTDFRSRVAGDPGRPQRPRRSSSDTASACTGHWSVDPRRRKSRPSARRVAETSLHAVDEAKP